MNLKTVLATDTSNIHTLTTPELEKFYEACERGVTKEAKKDFSMQLPEFRCKGMLAWKELCDRAGESRLDKLKKMAKKLGKHPDKAVQELVTAVLEYA